MMPTFNEIVKGQSINTDGISILPTVLGNNIQKKHDYLYFEFHEQGASQAIRKENWKLLHLNIQQEARYELYNIASDPAEIHNVIDLYPEKFDELRILMEKAHRYDANWPLLPSEFMK